MAVMGNKIVVALVALVTTGALWLGYQRLSADPQTPEPPAASTDDARAELLADKLDARDGHPSDQATGSLGGQVLDAATGQPLGQAVVLLTPAQGPAAIRREAGASGTRPRVLTDATGRFAVDGLPAGRYRISAAKLGFLPAVEPAVTLSAGDHQRGVVLRLATGGNTIEGIVDDLGGGPIEGALVRVGPASDRMIGHETMAYGAVTDEHGHYALSMPDGSWWITAGGEDYTADHRMVRVDHGPGRADFSLLPGAAIRGRVVSRATGAPVVDAKVSFSFDARHGNGSSHGTADPEQTAITDEAGRFHIHPLEPGQYSLYANARGLASAAKTVVHAAIGEQLTDVVVAVDPAFDVRGFVVDATDREHGIGNVQVTASVPQDNRYLRAQTEPDGYFEFRGVLPGRHVLLLDGEGVLPSNLQHSFEVEDRDPDDLLIELSYGVAVRGRVEPPQAGRVKVAPRETHGGMELMLARAQLTRAVAEIGDDGTFEIAGVPPGDWKLVADASDGSHGELEIEVNEAGPRDAVVTLAARSKVEGHVLDDAGEPVAGLTVSLEDTATPVRRGRRPGSVRIGGSGVTAADGSFAVWGVDPGEYSVVVRDPADQPVTVLGKPDPALTVEAVAGRDVADLQLRVTLPRGRIAGRVRGPDGEPMADAFVTARAQTDSKSFFGRRATTTITDAEGGFELDGLATDSYDLFARGADANTRGSAQGVRPDGERLELELETLAEIRGVVTHNGAPVTQFTLDAGLGAKHVIISPDGSFVLPRMEPGTRTVRASTDTGSAFAKAELSPGATVSIELSLAAWSTVEGTLVSAVDGTPLADIGIRSKSDGGARPGDSNPMAAIMGTGGPTTDDEGHFRIEGIGAGEVVLRFSHRVRRGSSEQLGLHRFALEPVASLDLGKIAVLAPARVSKDERGWLGLDTKVQTTTPANPIAQGPTAAASPDDPAKTRVSWVDPTGPAAKAGLAVGDHILEVDGVAESDVGPATMASALHEVRIRNGQSYGLTVERSGTPRTITVQAVARPREGPPTSRPRP